MSMSTRAHFRCAFSRRLFSHPENPSPLVHPNLPLQSFICCVFSTACYYFHFFSSQGFSPPSFPFAPSSPRLPPEGSLHSQLAESCQKRNITTIADVEMLIPSLVCPDYHSANFAAPCGQLFPHLSPNVKTSFRSHEYAAYTSYLKVLERVGSEANNWSSERSWAKDVVRHRWWVGLWMFVNLDCSIQIVHFWL